MNILNKELPILLKANKLVKNKYYKEKYVNYFSTVVFKNNSVEDMHVYVMEDTNYLNTIYTEKYSFCTNVVEDSGRVVLTPILWCNVKLSILEQKPEPFVFMLK